MEKAPEDSHANYLERRRSERNAKIAAHEWTDAQIMAARAITLIRRNLEPKCDGCGAGADRPNCAADMGGHCRRHEQPEVEAFERTIRSIERHADFPKDFDLRWETAMKLDLYNEFSEEEISLLMDLQDAGGRLSSRTIDDRFTSLGEKQAVYFSADQRWHVTITDRGRDLLARLAPEPERQNPPPVADEPAGP